MLRKEGRKVNAENLHIDGCPWAAIRLKPHQWKTSVSKTLRREMASSVVAELGS